MLLREILFSATKHFCQKHAVSCIKKLGDYSAASRSHTSSVPALLFITIYVDKERIEVLILNGLFCVWIQVTTFPFRKISLYLCTLYLIGNVKQIRQETKAERVFLKENSSTANQLNSD